jgi:hypothetical protein
MREGGAYGATAYQLMFSIDGLMQEDVCKGLQPRAQVLFRPEEVAQRIDDHRAGVRDHRKPLWTLLMFQLWYDRWQG